MSAAGCNELSLEMNPFVYDESEDRVAVVPTVDSWFFQLKSVLDRVLALALLAPMLPIIGCIVLLVRATSKGPGIYRQTRVGKGGRIFTMYKIRSMRLDAEGRTGPTWAGVVRDPRVTPLGYWLRHLHLDELPQLFNVLGGHMSLIGPRPERPEFVGILADQIPDYLDRLSIAPGITGLAQINLPPDTDLDSVRRKLALDGEYIRTAGILLDLRILLCTALRMLGIRHGRAVYLLALGREGKLTQGALPIGGASGGPTTLSTVANPAPLQVRKATLPDHGASYSSRSGQERRDGENQSLNETVELRDTIQFATVKMLATAVDSDSANAPHRRVTAK